MKRSKKESRIERLANNINLDHSETVKAYNDTVRAYNNAILARLEAAQKAHKIRMAQLKEEESSTGITYDF